MKQNNLILKGKICYSLSLQELAVFDNSYLVCEGGVSRGVFSDVPKEYESFPITDYGDSMIIPGLCDLHVHASQYAFRGLGMDLELIDWLNTHAFPEEAKFADLEYADMAYDAFVDDMKRGATTRACVFATLHSPATMLLMEKLEESGLVTFVGKVNMDTNSPEYLREKDSVSDTIADTKEWIKKSQNFKNTKPIITPRFIPTCTSELLSSLNELQMQHNLPVQSHLSENKEEIEWVKRLHPDIGSYGEVYDHFGMFGDTPTIMAHCVWSEGAEEDLLKKNGVYVAHCPQSNTNISSGIAPIRRFLNKGIRVGLGSDVAGGCHTSIFRAMSDAIQVSKLYYRLIDQHETPLTEKEAFYLGTKGGGSFFGKVGSFDAGYEFDAVVLSEASLERAIYLDASIRCKYVRGKLI